MGNDAAIIVGTGASHLARRLVREEVYVCTGSYPVAILRIRYRDADVLVLPRHGLRHAIPPHQIDHALNMAALRQLGVTHVIGLSAVGSLRADLGAGTVVVLDDFIGHREVPSLQAYPTGLSGPLHAHFTSPFCPTLRRILTNAFGPCDNCRPTGTYLQTAGPRFETPAEVRLYGTWGADVVGMTAVSEAIAARQSGLCYAGVACVTNFASGIEASEPTHGEIVSAMARVIEHIRFQLVDAALEAGLLPSCAGCQPRY